MASPQIDERFLQPLESMGLALEMKEVPLLILSEKDQWRFVQQITSILGGRGVYSGTADVTEQLLKSIKAPDYFFLMIEDTLPDKLTEVLRYYLDSRDILEPSSDAILQQKFRTQPIHSDHRLILLIDRDTLESQSSYMQMRLREICRVIAVS